MIIGYARVSTEDQDLTTQMEAIKKYARENKNDHYRIFSEKQSGGRTDREELAKAFDALRESDTFVTYKLDRLARSTKQLYEIKDQFEELNVHFVSISDNIDTSTAAGKAMFGMIAVFAEFERNLIQERTRAGLAAAKKQGRKGGRPAISQSKKNHIITLYDGGERATDLAKEYGIARSTVYKVVNEGAKT